MTEEFDPTDAFGEALELNSAVVQETRRIVLSIRTLVKAHLAIAEQLDKIADALTAACHDSAEALGDALVAELGAMSFVNDDDNDEIDSEGEEVG
ncbi:hypothetical protein ACFP2T_35820 [Plantactinospora solaniradicis]|uniref:Uncharacterized protein n=1 Tax=Plantactinospora solaniradicis TaxID=1723736 RepID=A0ABW1KIW3_9ACTN